MAMSSSSISAILAKPTKTSDDLQQIINQWHEDLMKNEEYLLQYAKELNQKQQMLTKTTESFIQGQDLLSNLEEDLLKFEKSIQTLTKYNDDLEKNIEHLNTEIKSLLPNVLSNLKAEQDRSITYELMESVDEDLNKLQQTMTQLHHNLQPNTDHSIFKTTDEFYKHVFTIFKLFKRIFNK